MKKLTKKETARLKELVSEATGKGWDDIALCDIINLIKLLGELADDFFCRQNKALFPTLPKDLPGRKRK